MFHLRAMIPQKICLRLTVRKIFIRSLKRPFFKTRIIWKTRHLFCLILCCSLSALSKWPLTFTNQNLSTCLPLISTQKVSINESNLIQYSSKSKSRYFISVLLKLQSYFFWNSFKVSPMQNPFLASIHFGISWKDLHIPEKKMW